MMKGSDIGIHEKKAKNKHFPDQIASNLKFLSNLQPEWSRHVTIVHQTKDLHTADYTQLYDFLKYNQREVDELKAKRLAKTQDPLALMANSNNPQIAQRGMNMGQDRQMQMVGGNGGNQFRQYAGQNARNPAGYNDVIRKQVIQNAVQNPRVQNVVNQNGLIGVQGNGNQNQIGNGNLVAARAEGNAAGQNGTQIRCYNCRGNYLQQPMPNPEDITDPTTAMNMALSLMSKAFKLNYSTPTNNNQRISSNPRNRQIAQPGMNMGQDRQMQMVRGNGGNQFRQYAGNLNGYNAVQNVGNQVAQNPRVQNDGIQNQIGNGNFVAVRAEKNAAGHNGNQIRCYNCRGVGHFARDCTVRPRRRDVAYLQTQLLIAQKKEAGIQL
nr:hypothetical protein [Tanacetum cinerariifolium]